MAASTTTGYPIPVSEQDISAYSTRVNCRRRISPESGRALEKLGHAIEYLTDEFVHDGGDLCVNDGQLQAVQLLMAINRQIYFACPQVPSLSRRIMSVFGIHEN
jgi:hypothetical protein